MIDFRTLARAATVAISIVLLGTAMPAECLQPRPEQPVPSWKTISRSARLAAAQEDYGRAIALYRQALKVHSRYDGRLEPGMDLKLNLVECHRLAGRLQDAEQVLDDVAAQINSQKLKDELLPARYWRKRSQLESDLGNDKAAAEAYLHSFLIVARYFAETSPHCRSCRTKLLSLMSKAPDSADKLIDVISTMHKRRLSADEWQLYDQLCVTAAEITPYMLHSASLLKSARYISRLAELTNGPDEVLPLWHLWMAKSAAANPKDRMTIAEDSLSKLLAESQQMHTPQAMATEITIRLDLANIANVRGDKVAVRSQWQRMTAVLKQMHANKDCPSCVIMEASKEPLGLLNRLVDHFAEHPWGVDEAVYAVTLADEWSKLNARIDPGCNRSSFKARYALARIRISQGRPADAEAPLSSLVPECPLQNKKLAELHLETAESYLNHADKAMSRRHWHLSSGYIKLAPDNSALLLRFTKLANQLN